MPADTSFGWEEFEYDLTPYMGNVVYIVWYHFYFGIDGLPQLGWLVDDVSITTETIVPGTIQITNNIWQAVWALSGPSGRNGSGRWTAITNAAPGQYILEFGDAPHYLTPAPQTNTLSGGGTVVFNGNYSFPDANTNGIPDGWEASNFGHVATNRTRFTDTDGDGQSDYAEFVAGTDPNNPPPAFRLTAQLVNGQVKLSWPSPTNIAYRIRAASHLAAANWQIYSGWFPASGTNTSFTLPAPTNGAPGLFRVEAASVSGLAGGFAATARRLGNHGVRLDWPTAPGHGYRVLGSVNATNWSPYSDWLRPTTFSTGLTLPARTNGAPYLFRIEAQP